MPTYLASIMRNFHPINIAITAFVLELLTDFIWRTEDSEQALEQLRNCRKDFEDGWSLKVFTDTLINTNNILMVYYLLRFMNELLASFVDNDKLLKFKRELRQNRYEIILETVKSRIEDRWYRLEYCTFEYVQRRIF